MLNGTAMTFSFITSLHCSITTPTSRFFRMIMPPLIHFLRTNNISPDLNPIEHVWDSPNQPANVNELRQALIQEWNNILQAEINTSSKFLPVSDNLWPWFLHQTLHHGTLFKRIYNNYSPGLFSSSYVQAKLAEVSFFCSVYMYNVPYSFFCINNIKF